MNKQGHRGQPGHSEEDQMVPSAMASSKSKRALPQIAVNASSSTHLPQDNEDAIRGPRQSQGNDNENPESELMENDSNQVGPLRHKNKIKSHLVRHTERCSWQSTSNGASRLGL